MPQNRPLPGTCLFSSAADARKRPTRYTPVCEQADDKADAVLLNSYDYPFKEATCVKEFSRLYCAVALWPFFHLLSPPLRFMLLERNVNVRKMRPVSAVRIANVNTAKPVKVNVNARQEKKAVPVKKDALANTAKPAKVTAPAA